jgi:Cellulase (glycosyl hydrolase family 5)
MLLRLSLLTALAVLLALPAAAPAASTQSMTFEAPRELLDPATRDRTLEEIRDFGVDRVRVLVYWQDFAPAPKARTRPDFDATDPGAYPAGAWDRLDALFQGAAARGIAVQLTLTGPAPRWATASRKDNVTKPSAKEFEAFATAVGRRYGDRVGSWSIWNEPNHPQFLRPQFVKGKARSPRLYRKLFLAGQRGLAASGNGGDTLLFGETAPRGTPRVVAPLAFLRGALCLDRSYHRRGRCRRLSMGGYAHHAYTTRVGPRFRPPDRDDVTIGVLSRLTRALDRAARAGAIARGVGLYLTEFGIQSTPDPIFGVSLARQAEYLGIAEHMAYVNPRVKAFSQYLLDDDKPRKGKRVDRYSGFESGLRRSDGRAKPAYDAFRLPLAAETYGRSDVLWGRVRPLAVRTQVTILVSPRKGRSFRALRTLTTNHRGVFGLRAKHRKHQRYRVRWTAPGGKVWFGPPIRPT